MKKIVSLANLLVKKPKDLSYYLYRAMTLRIYKGDPCKTREANKWMYDSVLLKLLLEGRGFENYTLKKFDESAIENRQRSNFDKSIKGAYPLEPSLYVECSKP